MRWTHGSIVRNASAELHRRATSQSRVMAPVFVDAPTLVNPTQMIPAAATRANAMASDASKFACGDKVTTSPTSAPVNEPVAVAAAVTATAVLAIARVALRETRAPDGDCLWSVMLIAVSFV